MNGTKKPLEQGWSTAWRVWLAVTAFVSLSSLALCGGWGMERLASLIQGGPLSIAGQTLACVAVTWLAWGMGLFLLKNPQIRAGSGAAIICSAVLLLVYVNFLRERIHYADVDDYVRAAFNLHDGQPFHGRYLYPPLLATLCQPLLPLGGHGLAALFWFANLVSLVAFFWLMCAVLERYGFEPRLALASVFFLMLLNVPILRTLGYVQINLHVINLILLAVLMFPRHRLLSALALALAVHLKASPILLAVPFLWSRDRVWAVSFLAGLIGFSGVTLCFYGWAPFASFLENVSHVYAANGICFRENSVDSLVRGAGAAFGADASSLVPVFKLPALLALVCVAWQAMRRATYSARGEGCPSVLNGFPALLVLMVFASPLVWEHHFVFLAVPFLVVIKKLDTPAAWTGYSFAYLLAFIMPTFDFYPWSYGRLISAIILTVLLFRASRRPDAEWFRTVGARIEACLGGAKKCG